MLATLPALCSRFARGLRSNRNAIQQRKAQLGAALGRIARQEADEMAETIRTRCGLSPEEFHQRRQLWGRFFNRVRQACRPQSMGGMEWEDVGQTGCRWTPEMLAKYLGRTDVRRFVPSALPSLPAPVLAVVRARLSLCLSTLHGYPVMADSKFTGLHQLSQMRRMANETTCRLLIDAMLFPVCEAAKVKVAVEPQYSSELFPTNRLDYQLFRDPGTTGGCGLPVPLGVVEAKSFHCFSSKGLAQAMVQLLSQDSSTGLATDRPRAGVLTDGYRFLFLKLTDQTLGVSGVYFARTWGELSRVMTMLYLMICP